MRAKEARAKALVAGQVVKDEELSNRARKLRLRVDYKIAEAAHAARFDTEYVLAQLDVMLVTEDDRRMFRMVAADLEADGFLVEEKHIGYLLLHRISW